MRSLVWFKNDLRIHDHPALDAASARGDVVACYCVSIAQWRSHDMGDWRLAFQLRTLQLLAAELAALNIPLKILATPDFSQVPEALGKLCAELEIQALDFIDEYPLNERQRDAAVARALAAAGINVTRHVADVLVEPGLLKTGKGGAYTVFTPFYRKWLEPVDRIVNHSCAVPARQRDLGIASDAPPGQWDGVSDQTGAAHWPAGSAAAQALLQDFVKQRVGRYGEDRDIPAVPGTSRLSAHLAVGAVSARQCVQAAMEASVHDAGLLGGVEKWISEIAWRDFYRHIVAQFDHVSKGFAFRRELDVLPWRHAPEELAAWQAGQTGYPLVDAAMRQLNETGWMHNRLRMVAAMFLSKHLLIDWRHGERYFMQRLVDGDFASNNGGWQWSASTGTDAAPYFRIFNPASQGTKFDKDGAFTKGYVPELAELPPKYLFEPQQAGVKGYPAPLVEHKFARERALAFFKSNL